MGLKEEPCIATYIVLFQLVNKICLYYDSTHKSQYLFCSTPSNHTFTFLNFMLQNVKSMPQTSKLLYLCLKVHFTSHCIDLGCARETRKGFLKAASSEPIIFTLLLIIISNSETHCLNILCNLVY